ncbi:uncharacterized protein SPAPADRAFT_48770 [Spathaspora passalidarum NRRL Y-27907]|uniref:Uncharacterized protein n=1 Tax=Spathaspora passalidarum (strain NRRL Y-27907 / 11-Y1) TaxID=619300 RepID=G3AEX9_SPAPN|nr:uncharacterized protein SPAPADRAFT_48770 [Spathaspora passalidarum NRRL Y-27907]EGW35809.1 hypothetical protein SPAPADRAFT_48770 [Spathaspora passalidarum NRRL Y-27907]
MKFDYKEEESTKERLLPTYKRPFDNVKNFFDLHSNATESLMNSPTSATSSQAHTNHTSTSVTSCEISQDILKLEVYERKSLQSFDLSSWCSFSVDFDSLSLEFETELVDAVPHEVESEMNFESIKEQNPEMISRVVTEEEFESITDSESIMESLKENTLMEKLMSLFKSKISKDSSTIQIPIHKQLSTMLKKPLLGPGRSATSGPIDLSMFQTPSEESTIYEGNIRFKREAEFIIYERSPSITSEQETKGNKYPGLTRFNLSRPKRKLSCFTKTFTIPRFSPRKEFMERSLSLPKRFGWSSANFSPKSDNKSILKSKINRNYEMETVQSLKEEAVDFQHFWENFENMEHEKSAKEETLSSIRVEQVQNYYHNYN